MNKIIASIALAVACATGYSQVTNTAGSFLSFLSQGSNFVAVPYVMYDTTDHSFGGGFALGYRALPNVVPTIRFDEVRGHLFVPSVNLTLEQAIPIGGTNVWAIPFAAGGVATSFNSRNTGDPIGIFGLGAAIRFDKKPLALLPDYILADYERWTGGGFNDNQVRVGIGWKLGKRS